jgi:dsRNA-specific ribonuclease
MDISRAENLIGQLFNDKSLLVAAFVTREGKVVDEKDNPPKYTKQVLAMLGDKWLMAFTTDYLIDNYTLRPDLIHDLRDAVVCNKHLEQVYYNSGIADVQKLFVKCELVLSPKVCGNYVEAVIGALYKDRGCDTVLQFLNINVFGNLDFESCGDQEIGMRNFIKRHRGRTKINNQISKSQKLDLIYS